jgi:hypothetical protein
MSLLFLMVTLGRHQRKKARVGSAPKMAGERPFARRDLGYLTPCIWQVARCESRQPDAIGILAQ